MTGEGFEPSPEIASKPRIAGATGAHSGARRNLASERPIGRRPDPVTTAGALAVPLDALGQALASLKPSDALAVIEHARAIVTLTPAKRWAVLSITHTVE